MKKILILFLVALSTGFTPYNIHLDSVADVYICNGSYSKKYHYNKNCRGLSNCSTKVEEVTLARAKELGRGLCGWED